MLNGYELVFNPLIFLYNHQKSCCELQLFKLTLLAHHLNTVCRLRFFLSEVFLSENLQKADQPSISPPMMSSEKQVLQEGLSVSARVEFRALHETPLSRAFLHALLWFFLLAKTTDFEEQRAPSKLKTNLTVSS